MGGNGCVLAARGAADSAASDAGQEKGRAQARCWATAQTCARVRRVGSGKGYPRNASAAPAPFTSAFRNGERPGSLNHYGKLGGEVRRNGGHGAAMAKRRRGPNEGTARARSRRPQSDGSGKTKGSNRHLLVDGHRVPLSLIVSAPNANDGKRIDEALSAVVFTGKRTALRRSKHLCADAGY